MCCFELSTKTNRNSPSELKVWRLVNILIGHYIVLIGQRSSLSTFSGWRWRHQEQTTWTQCDSNPAYENRYSYFLHSCVGVGTCGFAFQSTKYLFARHLHENEWITWSLILVCVFFSSSDLSPAGHGQDLNSVVWLYVCMHVCMTRSSEFLLRSANFPKRTEWPLIRR